MFCQHARVRRNNALNSDLRVALWTLLADDLLVPTQPLHQALVMEHVPTRAQFAKALALNERLHADDTISRLELVNNRVSLLERNKFDRLPVLILVSQARCVSKSEVRLLPAPVENDLHKHIGFLLAARLVSVPLPIDIFLCFASALPSLVELSKDHVS